MFAVLLSISAPAESIVFRGVLGNSGGAGEGLVKMQAGKDIRTAIGMGCVFDSQGFLWDRGGGEVLNRYSIDGRRMASFKLPSSTNNKDLLTSIGDNLVLLINGKLYTLNINAPAGAVPSPVRFQGEIETVSFGSSEKKMAVADKDRNLFLVDPVSGEAKNIGGLKEIERVDGIELLPGGEIIVFDGKTAHKFIGGREIKDEEWPRRIAGDREGGAGRIRFVDGYYYGNLWHGTVKRFNEELEVDPGVVLGGGSGHFIGHIEQNTEITFGRGIAKINDELYALSGMSGVMHLLKWDGTEKKMSIVRRIGSLPDLKSIAMDKGGNIWACTGTWYWNSKPDTPQRFGIADADRGQAVMLENDCVIVPAKGKDGISAAYGQLTEELGKEDKVENCKMQGELAGTAVYQDKKAKKQIMLVINGKGEGHGFEIAKDGKNCIRGDAGRISLSTVSPVREWTSLAMKGEDILLCAGDGQVIEMQRKDNDWQEVRRWRKWGNAPDQVFGDKIFISADSGRLWVSDSNRQRVLCFDLGDGKFISQYGAADRKGSGISEMDFPEILMARGKRALVYDKGNQRLLKLELE